MSSEGRREVVGVWREVSEGVRGEVIVDISGYF